MESQSQFCVQLKKGSWIVSLYPVSLFESILELKLWFNQDLIVFGLFIISSVQSLSCIQLFATPWTAARQASLSITKLPEFIQTRVYPAISSSVIPFSSCPESLPASESFLMSQFFAWGGQTIGVSASASVLPMNTQDWSPLGWTGWISLQSNGLSRIICNTTVQKHQFFGTQHSL